MGNSQSSAGTWPPINSVEVTPPTADAGGIRRHPKFKEALGVSAYADVHTCYEAFQ